MLKTSGIICHQIDILLSEVGISWEGGLGAHAGAGHGGSGLASRTSDAVDNHRLTRWREWASGISIDDPTRRTPSEMTKSHDFLRIGKSRHIPGRASRYALREGVTQRPRVRDQRRGSRNRSEIGSSKVW
jgi:hypothetical protein